MGTFEGEDFRRFQGLRAIHKSFLHDILGRAAPTYDWFQAICESVLHKILTSYGSMKVFTLESLLLYSVRYYYSHASVVEDDLKSRPYLPFISRFIRLQGSARIGMCKIKEP